MYQIDRSMKRLVASSVEAPTAKMNVVSRGSAFHFRLVFEEGSQQR